MGGSWGQAVGIEPLVLSGQALSGSGTELQGSHILDPATGCPATAHRAAWAAACDYHVVFIHENHLERLLPLVQRYRGDGAGLRADPAVYAFLRVMVNPGLTQPVRESRADADTGAAVDAEVLVDFYH